MHLAFNMFGLYMFGSALEQVLGRGRYILYYFACVIAAAITQLIVLQLAGTFVPTVGASGGVFGLVLGYAMFFPHHRIVLLIPPIPMSARTFALVYAVIELALGVLGSSKGSRISPTSAAWREAGCCCAIGDCGCARGCNGASRPDLQSNPQLTKGPAMADSPRDPAMDAKSLYREEIYTDRKMGTLRVMLPVTPDGAPDAGRPTLYLGEAQLMTNMGPMPISFDIEATSLADAVAKYGEAAKIGVEQALRELQEMRRQASSRS